ncbi:TPA: ATP synthase F1 subunit gamma [Candidatus Scatousia excrementigallinarum]|uniref:ATP synthase gamma chain n=1 Tax=Candidatus Scatousia excrementigallinarum TaxID=2840935 RepID=A0A9D1F0P4_9BACT|nr:ATP synthase F1 subunit gamma [Candidatus Scatousia excrementigallinarum]
MSNLKDIKNRIKSVESTKKITRAMKMVAAAKVKKAESTVKASRPFTAELNAMFKKLLNSVGTYSSNTLKIKSAVDNYPELLQVRNIKSAGMLVITSNKGLAGAYNANVVRKTLKKIQEYNEKGIHVILFVIGQKGVSALKRKVENYDCEIAKTYLNVANNPSGSACLMVVEDLADYYVNKKIDKIEIITTRFKNMMSYFVEEWEILPLKSPEANYERLHDNVAEPLMEFEPDMHNILQKVVPMYITNIIYQAMLEAQASELASRMTAMSAATSNAEKMITTLSIEYNKSRQAAITQEIVEVVSGANTQIN